MPVLDEAGFAMTLLSIFSDDQTAVLGCFLAMAVCGLTAALSFRLGPAGQAQKTRQNTLPIKRSLSDEVRSDERRAA